MNGITSVQRLLEEISNRKTIVYGTGYVSERFIESLRLHGLSDKIEYCASTNKDKERFKEYRVVDIKELKREYSGELICIATHEAVKDEIIHELEEKELIDYIWIHPFQHELRFGKPIEVNKEVELDKILERTKDDYRIAIRIMAIEQFYNQNCCGYDVYIKAQNLHCDLNTAKKRLERFINLIESWDKNGYLREERPCIGKNYEIIDGVHRIALAKYHGMKTMYCDIYDTDQGKEYRNKYIDVSKDVISEAGLTEEMEKLKEIQKKLELF